MVNLDYFWLIGQRGPPFVFSFSVHLLVVKLHLRGASQHPEVLVLLGTVMLLSLVLAALEVPSLHPVLGIGVLSLSLAHQVRPDFFVQVVIFIFAFSLLRRLEMLARFVLGRLTPIILNL